MLLRLVKLVNIFLLGRRSKQKECVKTIGGTEFRAPYFIHMWSVLYGSCYSKILTRRRTESSRGKCKISTLSLGNTNRILWCVPFSFYWQMHRLGGKEIEDTTLGKGDTKGFALLLSTSLSNAHNYKIFWAIPGTAKLSRTGLRSSSKFWEPFVSSRKTRAKLLNALEHAVLPEIWPNRI